MRIRILGGGWYGCHIGAELLKDGHDVEIHEIADRLFAGASGNNPARLHLGFHYPRSRITRAFCQEHNARFMARYGDLTHGVQTNIYAIARDDSILDFGTYIQVLRQELEFIAIDRPAEFGLRHVEGAVLTGERHILIDAVRAHFEDQLLDRVKLNGTGDPQGFDLTIDCTFAANGSASVARYEPCLVVLMKGPTDKAVTIMDGPFPSIYPWDETHGLCSLSSARFTPFSKECVSYGHARAILESLSQNQLLAQGHQMIDQMGEFFPAIWTDYSPAGYRTSIRAMPSSAADARLVDIAQTGPATLTVRAGKIDAIFHAADRVKEMIG